MEEKLISYLQCPDCSGNLIISKITEKKQIEQHVFITTGLLKCDNCFTLFPIIRRIPRLVRKSELSPTEKDSIKIISECTGNVLIQQERELSEKEKLLLIEKKLRVLLKPEKAISKVMREKIEHDLNYRVHYSDKKEKQVKTARLHYKGTMRSILEIGGGQGGTTTCFRDHFKPDIAISMDIELGLSEICQLRDPLINVIRADGTNIPIKDNCIDFVITTAVLEHIQHWKLCLSEIARISKQGLISYAPNKWCGFDWGHINGPIIPFLPQRYSIPLIYLVHTLGRTGRSYQSIKKAVNVLYYISRYSVEKELKKYGHVINVFSDFLNYSIIEEYHFTGGKFKKFLANHRIIKMIIVKVLLVLKIEPTVYLFFIKSQNPSVSSTGIPRALKNE